MLAFFPPARLYHRDPRSARRSSPPTSSSSWRAPKSGRRTRVATRRSTAGSRGSRPGFTAWLAGGGVKGGTVHGATDEIGYAGVEDPVHVHDLHDMILHLLGLDHTLLTFLHGGREQRLTDVHGKVVRNILA